MKLYGRRPGNRGNALVVVAVFFGFAAMGAAVYFYGSSTSASHETEARETRANSQAYAEMAAELAISNLKDVSYALNEKGEAVSINEDWVARGIFGTGDLAYERRISGRIGDSGGDGYDYVAKVVQVREAKKSDVAPDAWLTNLDIPDYNYGSDPVRKFTAAYEVTAVARNAGAGNSPVRAGEGSVQTVVTLGYRSAYNDLDKMATLHTDKPVGLMSAIGSGIGMRKMNNAALASPADDDTRDNLYVSSEDHYAIKTVAKTGIIDTVVEGLIRITALSTEFFSIYNNWWTYGKQTVQFMVGDTPNPNIPRTRNLSANLIDRQMIRLDNNREPDIYFNGGKIATSDADVPRFYNGSGWFSRHYKGRTVNIGDDGLIIETTQGQVNPTTAGLKNQKSLAVGSPEDFLKLYFNYVYPFNNGNWPVNNASAAAVETWKGDWKQVMFAHHPKNATVITRNDGARTYAQPKDNWRTPRRRRFPLLIMPMNADGAMLIREYDGTYETPRGGSSTPPDNWYGTYTWMYRLGITTVAGTNTRGYNGTWVKPTQQNGIATQKAMAPRKLSLQEFLGYQMTCDSNGVPAKFVNGQIVAGVPDYIYDASGQRVPYEPEGAAGNGSNFNESFQRENTTDNWGINARTLGMMPPLDGIYVRIAENDPDFQNGFPGGVPSEGFWQAPAARANDGKIRRYKRYQKLRDFAFLRDVSNKTLDPNAPDDMREVTSVFLSFDTNHESDADYFYYLLELSASIVWPTRTKIAGDDPGELFRHWWEGNPQESLTGQEPYIAISSWASPEVRQLPDGDRLKAVFETLGINDLANPNRFYTGIYNMLDSTNEMAGFNRVTFETIVPSKEDIGFPTPIEPLWEPGSTKFFYGDDDLWAVATAMYEAYNFDMFTDTQVTELLQLKNDGDVDGYNTKWEEFLKEQAQKRIESKTPAGHNFYHLDARFDSIHSRRKILFSKEMENLDKLLKIESTVSGRSLSLTTFGEERGKMPAVYAKLSDGGDLSRMTNSDFDGGGDNQPVGSTTAVVSLLPGEFRPKDGITPPDPIEPADYNLSISNLSYPWVQLMTRGTAVQPNGMPIEPKLIWREKPPLIQASPAAYALSMNDIRTAPDWFHYDPELGMDLYDTMLHGREDLDMKGYYRERRGALGWHREGPGAQVPNIYEDNPVATRLHEKIFGDHYEFVILTAWDPNYENDPAYGSTNGAGFIPYYTMETAENGTAGRYLALLRPESEDPLTPANKETFAPRLRPTSEMPTFVIEGEDLDGAGILVVNGNLHVKTRFAYHGVLIVLGDVLVEPEYYEKFDSLGNRLNANNEAIRHVNGIWYVIDPHTQEIKLDAEGNAAESKGGPANEWRGGIIVQGKMVAGGKVQVTPQVLDSAGDVVRPAGTVDVRTSRQAVEDTMGQWIKVGPNEGFESSRLGWTAGSTGSGNGTLWKE